MNSEIKLKDGTQSIVRAIKTLKLVAAQLDRGLRVSELAEVLQLSTPTAHRLLKSLSNEGMLRRDTASRRYHLGALVFELGLAAAHQFNLRDVCVPALSALSEESGDTSFLFVRSGNDAVCIQRVLGNFPIQTPVLPVGSRQPLGVSAGGLVLLANLPIEEMECVYHTIEPRLEAYGDLRVSELRHLVALAQKKGFAFIANHAVAGTSAVGLPVLSRCGACIAAITVASTQSRMNAAHIAEILPCLQRAVHKVAVLMQ